MCTKKKKLCSTKPLLVPVQRVQLCTLRLTGRSTVRYGTMWSPAKERGGGANKQQSAKQQNKSRKKKATIAKAQEMHRQKNELGTKKQKTGREIEVEMEEEKTTSCERKEISAKG
mmetsp:Transcript_69795/g.116304  ORF Transcript_69795/g.116304 Transcript_69795/m.116304 type:complete len:115 (+) Transcript_69795:2956-3300(+)